MKYEFHPAALQEYAEAVQFFAQQDKHQDFIDTIENAIFRMLAHQSVRQLLKARFADV
jgi:toxin ParE1/3/4